MTVNANVVELKPYQRPEGLGTTTAIQEFNYVIDPNRFYDIKEAAKLLHCEVSTMYSYNHNRRIKYYKRGGEVLYKGKDLLNFLVEVA